MATRKDQEKFVNNNFRFLPRFVQNVATSQKLVKTTTLEFQVKNQILSYTLCNNLSFEPWSVDYLNITIRTLQYHAKNLSINHNLKSGALHCPLCKRI